jgi:flagellar protein FliL
MAGASKERNTGGVIAVLLLTLLGGGAGAGFAMLVAGADLTTVASMKEGGKPEADGKQGAASDKGKPRADKHPETCGGEVTSGDSVVALPPVLSNLAMPTSRWLRLEASVVLGDGVKTLDDVQRNRISQDMLARVRTLHLGEIEGRDGLLNLKTDLHDLVRLRTGQEIKEIIINGMIIE